jgi:uncharacterized protein (TIGR01777 family)
VDVAVTGSSGLIGSALVRALHERGDRALRLVRRAPAASDEIAWDPAGGAIDAATLEGLSAVVHLAGYSIGTRWTSSRKRLIRDSRVDSTRLLATTLAQLERPPALLVCASAIGLYGERGDEVLTEDAPRGAGFLADVVEAGEAAADPAREAGIRVVHLRHGLVLARHGGALARLLLPFRLGLGGRVGSGRQWWSWVALEDVIRAYQHVIDGTLAGPVNVAAPEPATNLDFVRALGRALHRPAAMPFPAFAVRTLLGEMGDELLLTSQRVVPAALTSDGFAFSHPSLPEALGSALSR